jgi:hypothetical protein
MYMYIYILKLSWSSVQMTDVLTCQECQECQHKRVMRQQFLDKPRICSACKYPRNNTNFNTNSYYVKLPQSKPELVVPHRMEMTEQPRTHFHPPNGIITRGNVTHTDDSFEEDISKLLIQNKPMTELVIKNCFGLSGDTFGFLPISLKVLHLINCENITDDGFAKITKLSNLTELKIEGCNRITGNQFRYLPYTLRTLELKNCNGISDNAITELCGAHNLLNKLTIDGCSINTGSSFNQFPAYS